MRRVVGSDSCRLSRVNAFTVRVWVIDQSTTAGHTTAANVGAGSFPHPTAAKNATTTAKARARPAPEGRPCRRNNSVVLLPGVEVLAEGIAHVAVAPVDRHFLRPAALFDERRQDSGGLVEADERDGFGILGQYLAHFGVEGLCLRVVDDRLHDFATGCLEGPLEVFSKAGAVVVVEGEDGDAGVAVVGDDLAEHLTLED